MAKAAVAAFGGLLALCGASGAGKRGRRLGARRRLIRTHIAACGGAICATNTWAKNPRGDEKVGDKLVMTLNETEADHWTGSAFDPQRDRTYAMEMSVAGNRLTTRGCILGGLLCRSVGWTRIGALASPFAGICAKRLAPRLGVLQSRLEAYARGAGSRAEIEAFRIKPDRAPIRYFVGAPGTGEPRQKSGAARVDLSSKTAPPRSKASASTMSVKISFGVNAAARAKPPLK